VPPILLVEGLASPPENFAMHYDQLLLASTRELQPLRITVSGIPSPVRAGTALAQPSVNTPASVNTPPIKPRVLRDKLSRQSEFSQMASQVGAQSILLMRVHRFEERRGGKLGAERGAVVSFSLELRSLAPANEELWRSSFVFEDQAITDNILRIRDHFGENNQVGWRTAESSLHAGIDLALKELQSNLASLRSSRAQ
jgi:hypothetical protein